MRSQSCILTPCVVAPFARLQGRSPRLSRVSPCSSHCTCSFSKAFFVSYRHRTSVSFHGLSVLRLCGLALGLQVQHTHTRIRINITRLSRQSGLASQSVCLPGTILQGGPGLCSSTEPCCSAFTSVLVSRGFEHQFNSTIDTLTLPREVLRRAMPGGASVPA